MLTELPELHGASVHLEPLREAHAAALYPLLCEPELHRYTDDTPPTSLAEAAARFRRLETRRSPDGTERWWNWAVVVSERVIGYVQATISERSAQIAYVIGRKHQGRGYALDAVQAMLAYLEVAGVTTIHATIDDRNEPSKRLIARLEFKLAEGSDERSLRFCKVRISI